MTAKQPTNREGFDWLIDAMVEDVLNASDEDILSGACDDRSVSSASDARKIFARALESVGSIAQTLVNGAQNLPNTGDSGSHHQALPTQPSIGPRREDVGSNVASLDAHRNYKDAGQAERLRTRAPMPLQAAAADLTALTFEANFERDFEKVLDEYETLELPQGRISFCDDGTVVCVEFAEDICPTVLEFWVVLEPGVEDGLGYQLRRSERYPGHFEVEGMTTDEMERLVERHRGAPSRYPISWR
jgi:hypothetical protein